MDPPNDHVPELAHKFVHTDRNKRYILGKLLSALRAEINLDFTIRQNFDETVILATPTREAVARRAQVVRNIIEYAPKTYRFTVTGLN